MPNTTYQNITLAQQFSDAVSANVVKGLQTTISLYCSQWAFVWGLPLQNAAGVQIVASAPGSQPNALQPPAKFAGLSTVASRLTALGAKVLPLLETASDLKALVEGQANAIIAAVGVPAPGDSLSFLLPFISIPAGGSPIFTLPGTPVGYTVIPGDDGVSWSLTVAPVAPTTTAFSGS
jgi:hypothetical protein